jgi:hypothetical protein
MGADALVRHASTYALLLIVPDRPVDCTAIQARVDPTIPNRVARTFRGGTLELCRRAGTSDEAGGRCGIRVDAGTDPD